MSHTKFVLNEKTDQLEAFYDAETVAVKVAAEREACARDVCWRCAEGKPVERYVHAWVHPSFGICKATAIRERAYQQERAHQARVGGEGGE